MANIMLIPAILLGRWRNQSDGLFDIIGRIDPWTLSVLIGMVLDIIVMYALIKAYIDKKKKPRN